MRDLTALVPDHCLSFNFAKNNTDSVLMHYMQKKKKINK